MSIQGFWNPCPADSNKATAKSVRLTGMPSIPTVIHGKLDAITGFIYDMFGIDTIEVLVSGETFTVITKELTNSIRVIQGLSPEAISTHVFTENILATEMKIRLWQPQVNPMVATVYKCLGIDTVDIVVNNKVYTVIASQVVTAKAMILDSCRSTGTNTSAGTGTNTGAGAGTNTSTGTNIYHQIPINGAEFQEVYVGTPSNEVFVLAKMFGARFLRVVAGPARLNQGENAKVMCVISRSTPIGSVLEETLQRLGLYMTPC
jgi:hypothetical protein